MATVCIVGLPTQIRRRVEAAANAAGIEVFGIFCAKGREGSLRLIPHPDQAIDRLNEYLDSLEDYSAGNVLVLPYAPVPPDVNDELDEFKNLGADVAWIRPGGSWPEHPQKLDDTFFNALHAAIMETLPRPSRDSVLPSAYFQSVADRNPRLVLSPEALKFCDLVAPHRYEFMRSAADAFEEYLRSGAGGRIDQFFAQFGLEHAQTGGVDATLTFVVDGNAVYAETRKTHLKQGDRTTPQAAARIYYHAFVHQQESFVSVLYAGPHPDRDISCTQHYADRHD